MFPFVILAVLLGHPGDHPYSRGGMQINGSQRGISGKMVYEPERCPKAIPVAWTWSPYDFSSSHGGAPHGPGANGHH